MACVICKTPVDIQNDQTALNDYGRCRKCQKDIDKPKPWRAMDRNGKLWYGCYFPSSDLNVSEMGGRGTGEPHDVVWL